MAEIVLFGATAFEKRLSDIIEEDSDIKVVAFCVDRAYKHGNTLNNRPIIAFDELKKAYPPQHFDVLVGIGYKDMNGLRAAKYSLLKEMGYSCPNFVSSQAHVDKSTHLGQGNIVLGDAFIDYECELGDSNIIECGAHIAHNCTIGNFNYFSPSTCLGGTVHVGNRCFLGLHCTVRSAVKLEDKCLIGAGAYVDKNVPTDRVIVPARSKMLNQRSDEVSILVSKDRQWEECM